MDAPRVELLWWRECPSWERALADLRSAMEEVGLDPETIEVTEIDTEAEAEGRTFPGSPTIRIGGVDVEPAGALEAPGLFCRIYRRPGGRVSPLPDPDSLREALARSVPQ